MAELTLRTAGADDTDQILELIHELADYEKLAHEVVATPELIREALFGKDSVASCMLAEDAGDTVAFALYFFNFSTFLARPGLYVEDLYVRPDFRGRGIGTALLGKLARIARAKGCGRMEWSVLDWNEPAIQFYRSLGARPLEDWHVYRLTGDAMNQLAET